MEIASKLIENRYQSLAGAETTATAIRMILFHVYSNPRILSKLRKELRDARLSCPITNSEAASLPYLQAVIKEGIRICPPITGDMLKDVPPEGDTYNGQFIPGGTVIGFSTVGMLADRNVFGEDARTFRPERFLEGLEEQLQTRDAVVDAAFGSGRWRCLGKNIAQMELNKVIPEVSLRTLENRMMSGRVAPGIILISFFFFLLIIFFPFWGVSRLSAPLTFPSYTPRIPSRTTTLESRFSGICGCERHDMRLRT